MVGMLTLVYVLGFHVGQSDFPALAACFAGLFLVYVYVNCRREEGDGLSGNTWLWLGMAIVLRLLLTASVPLLSDDVYRFLWDGRLVDAGISPYVALPSHYLRPGQGVPGLDASLFAAFGSKDTHSCYPPLAQAQFWFGCHFSNGDDRTGIRLMKMWLLVFELGNIYLLIALLRRFRMPVSRVLLYALHPLVLLEGMGNLHFEVAMIYFVLWSVWLLGTALRSEGHRRMLWLAAAGVAFSLAVSAKLLPLLLLPFFWPHMPSRDRPVFFGSVAVGILVGFMPLYYGIGAKGSLAGFFNSLGLYFRQLEFNGSLYYLFRWIGYQFHGYNRIAVIGPMLGGAAALVLAVSAIRYATRGQQADAKPGPALFRRWMFAYSLYLLSATTVHPWYLSLAVVCSVFTRWKYALVWSALILLTYSSYRQEPFQENYGVVALEYTLVAAAWAVDQYRPGWWGRVCKFEDPRSLLLRIWAYRSIFAALRR